MRRVDTRWLYIRRILVLPGVGVLMYCAESEPPIDQRLWALARCIECIDGEQAAVVAMSDSAIPGLRYFLLHGPPDSTVDRQRTALSGPFQIGATSSQPTAPGGRNPTVVVSPGTSPAPASSVVVPPAAVVSEGIEDFKAVYRMRSSAALGLIGGDSARRVLCEGKAAQFRPDVRARIDSALVQLNGSCP